MNYVHCIFVSFGSKCRNLYLQAKRIKTKIGFFCRFLNFRFDLLINYRCKCCIACYLFLLNFVGVPLTRQQHFRRAPGLPDGANPARLCYDLLNIEHRHMLQILHGVNQSYFLVFSKVVHTDSANLYFLLIKQFCTLSAG